jgi:DNA-binding NarL/FixJ family response regulator
MIRLVLVDDQALIRAGIATLLGLTGDIQVVGEAADGEAALKVITEMQPDVVLLDVRLPKFSGIDVLQALSDQGRLPPTILLTTFDDDDALKRGMEAGAKGFLLKDISLEKLSEAIREVAAGKSLFLPGMTQQVNAWVADHADMNGSINEISTALTRRETEILRLLAAGMSNREIAAAIGNQEGTIKNHVSNILAKLGVRDRSRAVLRAIQLGCL